VLTGCSEAKQRLASVSTGARFLYMVVGTARRRCQASGRSAAKPDAKPFASAALALTAGKCQSRS
jgi:hypothetical protein